MNIKKREPTIKVVSRFLWFCYKINVLCPYNRERLVATKSALRRRIYKPLADGSVIFHGEEPQTSATGGISAKKCRRKSESCGDVVQVTRPRDPLRCARGSLQSFPRETFSYLKCRFNFYINIKGKKHTI